MDEARVKEVLASTSKDALIGLVLVATRREEEERQKATALEAENARLRAALEDLRDYGTRRDLMPTVAVQRGPLEMYEWLTGYLGDADRYVREVARLALNPPADV